MERAGIKVDERILGPWLASWRPDPGGRAGGLQRRRAPVHRSTPPAAGAGAGGGLHSPLTKRTKTGYSTDATVLEELAGVHPVIEHILQLPATDQAQVHLRGRPAGPDQPPHGAGPHHLSTRPSPPRGASPASARTYRTSPCAPSCGPIRRAFVAEGPDAVLFAADYAQIELRIAAHITRDPLLVEAFQRDEDVHAATAATVFGVPLERVSDEQRRLAKTTNFAVLYGISDFGLSQRVGIARSDAAPFIKSYLEKYTGINTYIHSTLKSARERGYVETPLGRRRYIPELRSNNPAVRGAGERMAINMPIQGAQADLIKLAMIRIEQALRGVGAAGEDAPAGARRAGLRDAAGRGAPAGPAGAGGDGGGLG